MLEPGGSAPLRLDRALAEAAALSGEPISRTRLRAWIEDGRVDLALPDGRATVRDPSFEVKARLEVEIAAPPPAPTTPGAEALSLEIVFEDAALAVVDKPAGMTTHPAPGVASGTLVNALLYHFGALSSIGAPLRPGIVHRLDKDTSGLLVVAKTDAAHLALARGFAAHDIERRYRALTFGAPTAADPRIAGLAGVTAEKGALRIEAPIGRHPTDRTRMAVARRGGRPAVTHVRLLRRFVGGSGRVEAAEVACTLETGRTHQIRVHLAHIGRPILGDPTYGRARSASAWPEPARDAVASIGRQALHAEVLGFTHPITGAPLRFERAPPEDYLALAAVLEATLATT